MIEIRTLWILHEPPCNAIAGPFGTYASTAFNETFLESTASKVDFITLP